ncbi:MAG: DUF2085 domain-containing protein [Anaerolineaceae bacterium]
MINITLFGANEADFNLAGKDLDRLKEEFQFQIFQIDIHNDPMVLEKYQDKTPVMIIGPYTLIHPFNEQDLRIALGAAGDREKHLAMMPDSDYSRKKSQGRKITGADRIMYWLSQHFMLLINLFLFLYVGLPFLAPVLMKVGADRPAKIIYTIYSPLCHQLAFRSWFLFGEQAFYPRALAEIPDVLTYEQISGGDDLDVLVARTFIGDEVIGYKVALCERDIAIYASMLLFGMIFSLTRNRIQPVRWYIWIVVGLIPIGLDGVSQLPGLMNRVPDWLLMRESTPFLRSLTGALFGITTAWYLFPLIDMSMRETREILFRKISINQNRS